MPNFKQGILLIRVRWNLAYPLRYRDIEELTLERGLKIDHSTINHLVIGYSPQLEEAFYKRSKRPVGISWCMIELHHILKKNQRNQSTGQTNFEHLYGLAA